MFSFVMNEHLYHLLCFFQAMDNVRRSQSSDVLTEAEEVSAFLLELAHFFQEWRFTLPDVLILLLVTLISFVFFRYAWSSEISKLKCVVYGGACLGSTLPCIKS